MVSRRWRVETFVSPALGVGIVRGVFEEGKEEVGQVLDDECTVGISVGGLAIFPVRQVKPRKEKKFMGGKIMRETYVTEEHQKDGRLSQFEGVQGC
ncbi:unnamed protein product [Allacma fusca]|uniref:Uncharacterized protein n=1 Tax=Allacma fusca TaxID=39272 RepID=A0A8J2KUI6_9HEXA|nr:unnamed protein product [Allacma fusca]